MKQKGRASVGICDLAPRKKFLYWGLVRKKRRPRDRGRAIIEVLFIFMVIGRNLELAAVRCWDHFGGYSEKKFEEKMTSLVP